MHNSAICIYFSFRQMITMNTCHFPALGNAKPGWDEDQVYFSVFRYFANIHDGIRGFLTAFIDSIVNINSSRLNDAYMRRY